MQMTRVSKKLQFVRGTVLLRFYFKRKNFEFGMINEGKFLTAWLHSEDLFASNKVNNNLKIFKLDLVNAGNQEIFNN